MWVHCEDAAACGPAAGQCWLKHLAHPEAITPRTGPDVPWTAGLKRGARPAPAPVPQAGGAERAYHTVITAAGPAVHWQSRVHYYWFLKQKAACVAGLGVSTCQMGGFTRILHSGAPDDLVGEIPTFVAQPLKDKG